MIALVSSTAFICTKLKTRKSFRSSGFFVVFNFNQRAVTVSGIVSWALPPALSVTTTFI